MLEKPHWVTEGLRGKREVARCWASSYDPLSFIHAKSISQLRSLGEQRKPGHCYKQAGVAQMAPQASKDHTNSVDVWVPGAALNTPPRLFSLILTILLGAKYSFPFTGWEAGRLGGWEAGRLGGWEAGRLGGWEAGRLGGWEAGKEDMLLQGHTARGSEMPPNPRRLDPRVQAPTLL
jgi:hypothetical protein